RCLEGLEYIHAAAPDLSAASTQAPQAHEVSEPLGDFRIVRELGHGGMGIVYEAEQMSLGRRGALKVLPFAATLDSRHLQRFKNEALAAATLDHPHIVGVYGVGADRGVPYYAIRLIGGQKLAQVITQWRGRPANGGPRPPRGSARCGTRPRARGFRFRGFPRGGWGPGPPPPPMGRRITRQGLPSLARPPAQCRAPSLRNAPISSPS